MRLFRLTGWMAVPVVLFLSTAGCATKGFVRSQMSELRADMGQVDSRLKSEDQKNADLTLSALARADSAYVKAGGAWTAALGEVGLQEAGRSRVYFDFNSATLTAEGQSILNETSSRIAANPQYVVQIFGFADPTGPQEYNLALAQRRAAAVERYLVASDPAQLMRFHSISFGEEIPRSEAPAIGDKAQQRQVLVVLVERAPLESREPGIAAR
jgi:outer membrane protein OmpA-like peptidoglycan-associated protein